MTNCISDINTLDLCISDINTLDLKKLPSFVKKNKKKISDRITDIVLGIKKEDRLSIVLKKINNVTTKMLKYLKYYESPIFYFHDLPNHEENIYNIFPIMEKLEKDNFNELKILINYPWLYNISYVNFNKKDILLKYNKILNSKLPIKFRKAKNNIKKHRIKLGIVGFTINYDDKPGFELHSVYRDRAEIIKRLDSKIFEKYLIVKEKKSSEYLNDSPFGHLLGELYDKMDNIVTLNNYNFSKIDDLMNLDLDILLYPDIGMNPFTVIMGNYRIAPVQINTWGHSVTSGIENIDYYISSKYYELEDLNKAQEHYSEKLIAMNSLCTYYKAYTLQETISKDQLGIPNNKQVLFCMQNTRKLNKEFFNVLKKIIKSKPNIIILVLKKFIIDTNIDYINKITGSKKNIIFVDECDTHMYLNYLYHSTLVLDTYPFGGCNTSLEAFSLGKIIITYPSEYLPGRFTYGFYKKMDILEPVVNNYDDYLQKVIYYLENDIDRKKLENKILEKKKLLFNETESVKEWDKTLVELSKPYVELIEDIRPTDELEESNQSLDKDKLDLIKNNEKKDLEKMITILILSNQTKKSLKCLELLYINLLYNCPELKKCKFILCHDINDDDTVDYYDKLEIFCNLYNIELIKNDKSFVFNKNTYNCDNWGANIINLITKCKTEYFMFLEHDWIFNSKININNILDLFINNKFINYIRFNKRSPSSSALANGGSLWDIFLKYYDNLNLTRTCNFSNNPYISRKSVWINDWIPKLINNNRITTIEHDINFNITSLMKLYEDWGLYIYGNVRDEPLIRHTDGRDEYENFDKGLSIEMIDKKILGYSENL